MSELRNVCPFRPHLIHAGRQVAEYQFTIYLHINYALVVFPLKMKKVIISAMITHHHMPSSMLAVCITVLKFAEKLIPSGIARTELSRADLCVRGPAQRS